MFFHRTSMRKHPKGFLLPSTFPCDISCYHGEAKTSTLTRADLGKWPLTKACTLGRQLWVASSQSLPVTFLHISQWNHVCCRSHCRLPHALQSQKAYTTRISTLNLDLPWYWRPLPCRCKLVPYQHRTWTPCSGRQCARRWCWVLVSWQCSSFNDQREIEHLHLGCELCAAHHLLTSQCDGLHQSLSSSKVICPSGWAEAGSSHEEKAGKD